MENSFSIGAVEIVSLTDGEVDFGALVDIFPDVPAQEWPPFRERFPGVFAGEATWHVHFGCHLIRADGQTILVDTGIGPNPSATMGGVPGLLIAELKACSFAPEDIDMVFLTHTHPDHVGWNFGVGGAPYFPRARYVLSRKEWSWAEGRIGTPGLAGSASMLESVAPLGKLDALQLLEGETSLTSSVTAIETPGHTPGHMSLIISSQGEKACLTGDAMVHPAQITHPEWAPRMDSDKDASTATRARLLERLEAEGMSLVGCHFPSPGYGQVVRMEGRRYWQAGPPV